MCLKSLTLRQIDSCSRVTRLSCFLISLSKREEIDSYEWKNELAKPAWIKVTNKILKLMEMKGKNTLKFIEINGA